MHILATTPDLRSVVFQVPVAGLTFVLATLCPIAVALITKSNANSIVKAVLNGGLAALAALLAVSIKNEGWIDAWHYLFYIGEAMVTAYGMYSGLFKHVIDQTNSFGTSHIGFGGSKPAIVAND